MLVELAMGYVLAWTVFNSFCSNGGVITIDLEEDIHVFILEYLASSTD